MSNNPMWSIDFCLTSQQLWQNSDAAPTLPFIPVMSRRRLSPLARIVLQLAHDISQDQAPLPQRMVFASRHGEIISTSKMLHDLAQNEALSPAAFSHSVHNALPGLWSIFQQQHGECSAISAGLDTLPMALLEATGFLNYDSAGFLNNDSAELLNRDAASPVLTIIADEIPPECFQSGLTEIAATYALALLLDKNKANLRLSAIERVAPLPLAQPAALAWYDWWLSETTAPLILAGERHDWRWEKI